MQVRFPSADVPAFPSVSLDAPDGWSLVAVPAALFAVVGPVPPGEFAPNLVVSIDRHLTPYPLGEGAEALRSSLLGHPEAELVGAKEVEIDGRPTFAIEVAFRDEAAGTVVQTHRLMPVEAGATTDVVHVVGTCAGDAIQDDLPPIRSAADSIHVLHAAEA